ncbi:MAG: DUF5678 domain-containing protein [Nanoarchaeota archaeon]
MDLVMNLLRTGWQDSLWMEKNIVFLKQKYDNEFIAVHTEDVLAHDADLDKLLQKVAKKGINPSEVLVEFVSKVPKIL